MMVGAGRLRWFDIWKIPLGGGAGQAPFGLSHWYIYYNTTFGIYQYLTQPAFRPHVGLGPRLGGGSRSSTRTPAWSWMVARPRRRVRGSRLVISNPRAWARATASRSACWRRRSGPGAFGVVMTWPPWGHRPRSLAPCGRGFRGPGPGYRSQDWSWRPQRRWALPRPTR